MFITILSIHGGKFACGLLKRGGRGLGSVASWKCLPSYSVHLESRCGEFCG